MSLDYNILWFEDSEDYIISLKPRLEDFIEGFGFEPKFTIVPNGSNLSELLDNNSFDIILMDFNLDVESGNDGNGDVLINSIRDQEYYIEILFYSAHSGFRNHINMHLDGVFFADRDELFEKSKKVINLTIKKSQDINNLRGLVIAESIDIESKMEEMLKFYFRIDNEKDAVFRKIVNPSFNALNFKKKFDLINRICKIKVKCLEKINNGMGNDGELKEKIGNLKQLKKDIGKIEKEIIDVRNILAHTKEDPEKKNTLVSRINKNKEEIIITDNWCKEKRNDIRRQSENLERLFSYIREND
jgi:CheY-like chemotaxis protein